MGEKGEGKVDPKAIKKTQDTLGKIIKKPPMTEKLLAKPPFRFLHDVMTSVIKSTGFMKGLYTNAESQSDNVKEKEAKTAFLQKAIDIVSLVTGKTVSAKPTKIVAGQEPDKTNEFLQMLADAINKKVDNDDYVQRVLKGDSGGKPPTGDKKEKKERKHRDKDEKKDRDEGGDDRDKRHRSKDRDREKDDRKKDRKDRDKHRERSKDRERSREKSADRRHRDRDAEKEGSSDRHKDRDRRKRDKERERSAEKPRDEPQENGDAEEGADDGQEEAKARRPRPNSAKGSRRHRGRRGGDSDDEEEAKPAEKPRERKPEQTNGAIGEDDVPPQVAAARKMARPSSARPAPPKVKKNDAAETPAMIVGSGNVPNVITDKDDSDDDDIFIAKDDDVPEPEPEPERPQEEEDESGEHGGLVKKMLEKKKQLESGSQIASAPKKTEIERSSHVNDAQKRKERDMIQKDIDRLRASIQTLTRSVNPLGKIMDFLQEDLDSMQKELEMWKKENKGNAVALQREQSITESSVEPLKAQLQELDQAIADQLDLIAAVKSNILRDDDRVDKMLSTLTKS